jgi:hypothetical protein
MLVVLLLVLVPNRHVHPSCKPTVCQYPSMKAT